MPAPSNDNFASAQLLSGTSGSDPGIDLTDATVEASEPNVNGTSTGNSVWYRWDAPATPPAWMQFDLMTDLASGADPIMAIYTGTALNDLVQVAYNDDSPVSLGSVCRIQPVASTTYWIQVFEYIPTSIHGPMTLTYAEYTPPPAPANDNFLDAVAITDAASELGSTYGATNETGETPDPGATVWFDYTVPTPVPDSIVFSLYSPDTNAYTEGMVYRGTSAANADLQQLGEPFATAFYANPPGTDHGDLTLTVGGSTLVAGEVLRIKVVGPGDFAWSATDAFRLMVTPVTPPTNDDFANREYIGDVTNGLISLNGDITLSTLETNEPVAAGAGTLSGTVWFEWLAPSADVNLVTFTGVWNGGLGAKGHIAIRTGPLDGNGFPGLVDATGGATAASGNLEISFVPVPGQTYYIQYGLNADTTSLSPLTVETQWVPPENPPVPDVPSIASRLRALMSTRVTMPTPTLVDGKPQDWAPTSVTKAVAGMFVIMMGPAGEAMTDVTYFRDVPTELANYSFIDPFTYASAVVRFPQITPLEALPAFLGDEDNPANVDIWWFDLVPGADIINPLTGARDLTWGTGTKLWEGYIASADFESSETTTYLEVQCQGALFQFDGYKQKPFFPRRPYVLERLMYEVVYPWAEDAHPWAKPHSRCLPMLTRWPTGWTKKVPARKADEPNLFTPVIPPGRLWTGYTTRNTGSWENLLTGYIADMLAVMWTTDDSGVTAGNQWTLRCEAPRQPVLEVRDRNRTPDFEVWAATPGVSIRVSSDYTRKENVLYGEGSGEDGTVWRNAFITGAWNRTDYEPLAHDAALYPAETANTSLDTNRIVHESFTKYGVGMNLDGATTSAAKRYAEAKDAGLSGTMTLRIDPAALTRWQIRAGMTVKVKGLKGTGTTGVNFHIAEVVVNVGAGTVECQIDTKYRDLMTLEEARQRNIDPMTPSKLLQVNKRSVTVEDLIAPWDYDAGSGYIPSSARYGKTKGAPAFNYFKGKSYDVRFPWDTWLLANPPKKGSYAVSADGFTKGPFVRVDADAAASKDRWSFVPILTSHRGTIRRTEVVCCDADGNILEIPFHMSIYYTHVDHTNMPHTGGSGTKGNPTANYSPFQTGAFESTDATGNPWPAGSWLSPDQHLIIGWGNSEQKAGHSPGLSSKGYPATGLLVDESTWTFDNSANPDLDKQAGEGNGAEVKDAIILYAAFYAEHTENVFFMGRLYKQHQDG